MLLEDLHTNILAAIVTVFGQAVPTIGAYPYIEDAIVTPAILLELDELEPNAKQPGTGEISLITHWHASVIIGFNEETGDIHPRVVVADLAAQLMNLVQDNRFDLSKVGQAELKPAMPDGFDPTWDGYFAWKVEWINEIWVGKNVWEEGEMVLPQKVLVSLAPDIGEKDKDKYAEVGGVV